MIVAIKTLFQSKKFLMTIVAVLVALGAKLGLNLDSETVSLIVGVFATAIIGQGIADHGKEAAKINAQVANDNKAPNAPVTNITNTAAMLAVVLFSLGVIASSGCGPSARQTEINTARTALNAASDGFASFSTQHAKDIIASCDPATLPREQCEAKLANYRVLEAKVVAAMSAAYSALGAAVALNDQHSLANALLALSLAQQAYDDLKKAGI